ncbi:hypothetical protein ANAPH2_00581 [Anaplasma phagocytophilum]|nr:hypothetical protein ANAPH2_00581 [Anaplasma phagocytophilum]
MEFEIIKYCSGDALELLSHSSLYNGSCSEIILVKNIKRQSMLSSLEIYKNAFTSYIRARLPLKCKAIYSFACGVRFKDHLSTRHMYHI